MCTVKIMSSDDTHCLRTYCKHWSSLTLTGFLNFSIWIKSKLSDIFNKKKPIRSSSCVKILIFPRKCNASMGMFTGQKYSLMFLYPTILYSIRKLVFHWKLWKQTWWSLLQNATFLPKNMACGSHRAMKSVSKVKIGQIVHHTVLFLKRSRHLGYPDYVVCYSGSKSVWDANIGFQASVI